MNVLQNKTQSCNIDYQIELKKQIDKNHRLQKYFNDKLDEEKKISKVFQQGEQNEEEIRKLKDENSRLNREMSELRQTLGVQNVNKQNQTQPELTLVRQVVKFQPHMMVTRRNLQNNSPDAKRQ